MFLSGLKCTYTKSATSFGFLIFIPKYILDSLLRIDCNNINNAMGIKEML